MKLATRFQQKETCFQQKEISFQDKETSFEQSETCFQQKGTCFQQKETTFEQEETCFQLAEISFQLAETSFQRKETCFQHEKISTQLRFRRAFERKCHRRVEVLIFEFWRPQKLAKAFTLAKAYDRAPYSQKRLRFWKQIELYLFDLALPL